MKFQKHYVKPPVHFMKLHLRVVEASNLAQLNTQDGVYPYCLVQLSNSSQIQRTASGIRTSDPVWDDEFCFQVRHKTDSLKIFVKDSNQRRCQSVLSTITLRLKDFEPGKDIDEWFNLVPVKGVQTGGSIHLMFRLEPTEPLPQKLPSRKVSIAKTIEQVSENEPQPRALETVPGSIPLVEPAPVKARTPKRQSILIVSTDFGSIVDTQNPNDVKIIPNIFSEIRESPAKMYTADAMSLLQMEKDIPIFGPHWALAKIAAVLCHKGCDYFTEFGAVGCEKSTRDMVTNLKEFFCESNHDINRNRVHASEVPVIGPLLIALFKACDTAIAAMASKKTLFAAKAAIADAMILISNISQNPNESDSFEKTKDALFKGFRSPADRDDGAFYRNLEGAPLNSLGLNAAVAALGLSALEHSMNCYICNSFGSRICLPPTPRAITSMSPAKPSILKPVVSPIKIPCLSPRRI
jgi:hypothetical protein